MMSTSEALKKLHDTAEHRELKELVCELCRQFFQMGWVTGTGGSISIRDGEKILMTPSGVPKERIKPDQLFVLDRNGVVLARPEFGLMKNPPKLSDCAPLFMHAYRKRNAGAVIHSHGQVTNLVTILFGDQSEFRISHQEMIKGIKGHGYFDEMIIPIIENTAYEHELADSLGAAIDAYPKAVAVLVRRHGLYVWGDTWQEAKKHAECVHYLFEISLKLSSMPIASHSCGPCIKKNIGFKKLLLDIEGTVSPLSYVREILFPYAAAEVQFFLNSTWFDPKTQSIVRELLKQLEDDMTNLSDLPPQLKEGVVERKLGNVGHFVFDMESCDRWQKLLSEYVQWSITMDRKIPSLKLLQGSIWEVGYRKGELVGQLFAEVPRMLKIIHDLGVKIYIYSSGSRHAQNLLFKHSSSGDVREWLSGYFDTSVGSKLDPSSYTNIGLYLGCDDMQDCLFISDMLGELVAAQAAGFQVMLAMRPGNVPVQDKHEIRLLSSLSDLII